MDARHHSLSGSSPAARDLVRYVFETSSAAQARQPYFQSLLFDASKRHPIHTWRTRIKASEPIGVDQDVLATESLSVESR